jgi:Protein of unknown function (DUF3667)
LTSNAFALYRLTPNLGGGMDLIGDINIENAAPLSVASTPAKSRKKHHKPHDDCLNCGAILVGEHCHACGQHGHVHRSVFHVIEEVIHGITHLDSRAWRSLPMLAFRPGTLTRNYVMGQRARYVPPFAMFLFSIFAMFLVFAFSGGPNLVTVAAVTKSEQVQSAREQLSQNESDLTEAQTEVEAAQAELSKLNAASSSQPGDIEAATGELTGAQQQVVAALRKVQEAKAALAAAIAKPESNAILAEGKSVAGAKATFSFDSEAERKGVLDKIAKEGASARSNGNGLETGVLGAVESAAKATPLTGTPDQIARVDGTKGDGAQDIMSMLKDSMRRGGFINTSWPALNEKIKYKTKNPDLFLYKLQNTAYKFSFLLVPLSLPFIWLMLFWKKNVTLFDHAVFALYSLSFVSFLFMMISLVARWMSPGWGFAVAAVVLPVHIFYQFKGAYQLKWFSAFWRTSLFCMIFSWVIIATFFVSIIALGVTG